MFPGPPSVATPSVWIAGVEYSTRVVDGKVVLGDSVGARGGLGLESLHHLHGFCSLLHRQARLCMYRVCLLYHQPCMRSSMMNRKSQLDLP